MKASMELVANDPPTYVLRLHDNGGFGDPYFGSATVTVQDGLATIRGLSMAAGTRLVGETWRAINDALWARQVREVERTRIRRGVPHVQRGRVMRPKNPTTKGIQP